MEYGNRNDPPTSVSVSHPVNIRRPLSQETEQSASSRNSHCMVHAILLLVMWFLILCLALKIAWHVVNPRRPDFQLNSLSVSNVSLSNSKLAASYKVELTVNNTNKKFHITIDGIEIAVLYGNNVVSRGALEETDRDVGKMSHEALHAELGMDSVRTVKHQVFRYMSNDWSQKTVNFNVEISLSITFRFGIWPSEKKRASVSCMNLRVEFVSTKGRGELIGGEKVCSVHYVHFVYDFLLLIFL